MSSGLVCFMFRGRMTNGMRSKVLQVALEMAQKGRRSRRFKTKECEGRVTTRGQRALLGSFAGVVFEAVMESNLGKANVRFIVDTSFGPEVVEDERYGWVSSDDLRRAQSAHLN